MLQLKKRNTVKINRIKEPHFHVKKCGWVPSCCVVNGAKYCQYKEVDERTRWIYRAMYDEHSTYSSDDFIEKFIHAAPFPIREIQTDNGTEWTTALISNHGNKTMFENKLEDYGIKISPNKGSNTKT